jgi:hypothetical protein
MLSHPRTPAFRLRSTGFARVRLDRSGACRPRLHQPSGVPTQTASASQRGSIGFNSVSQKLQALNGGDRRYLRMVFRDTPSRREISRIGTCSRLCHRRMMLKNAMSNTPIPPPDPDGAAFKHWSILSGKIRPSRVRSQWKSTGSLLGRWFRPFRSALKGASTCAAPASWRIQSTPPHQGREP